MVVSAQKDVGSIGKPRVTSNVEGSVSIAIADQRVGAGLEQVLDHLVLASEHGQVEWGLEGRDGEEYEICTRYH